MDRDKNLKAGDKLICIDAPGPDEGEVGEFPIDGNVYTVTRFTQHGLSVYLVYFKEITGGWYLSRFKPHGSVGFIIE